ncbi:MAG: M12 family metallo-peptidase [Marmoricola sp.]
MLLPRLRRPPALTGRLVRRLALSALCAAVLAGTFAAAAAAAPVVLAAAPDPAAQHAYVVEVTNKGDLADPDATVLSVVDTALQRWVVESDHVISSFTRVGGLHPLETATDCTDLGALWDEAKQLFPGVDFAGASGNHLIVIGPATCPSGRGTVGNGLHSGGLLTVRYNPDSSLHTLLHELGHNFGLEHDHALACNPGCADVTYGNEYSFMGYTTPHHPAYVPGALDSYQRQLLGIDEHCEIRQAELTNGQVAGRATYVLAPRGTDDGARGVRVVDPQTGSVYYLDFRNGAGRDADAFYVGSDSFREGVTIEKVTTDSAGDAVTQLQSTPDDHYGAVYSTVAGGTFQTGGISVHVDQLGTPDDAGATATVTVTLTTAPGLDAAAQPLTDGCESVAVTPSPSASASLPPVEITPTELPTTLPTDVPTDVPTVMPTVAPTVAPTTPTGVPTSLPTTPPKHDPPGDTSNHPPTPPQHELLPGTGSPRELLAEIAAAAFALAFGGVLVLAARRPRARPAGRVR